MARRSQPHPPTEAGLRSLLGPTFMAYRALLDAHRDLRPEWKWYGQKNGWSLKLLDGKRNLCFLHPSEGYLSVAFIFGHDAVERALASDLPAGVRQAVIDAPTYPEGRAVRLEVRTEADLGPVHTLIEAKRGPVRKQARAPAGHGPVEPAGPPVGRRAPAPPRPEPRTPAHRRGRSPG